MQVKEVQRSTPMTIVNQLRTGTDMALSIDVRGFLMTSAYL
jgi:hypothetical protein